MRPSPADADLLWAEPARLRQAAGFRRDPLGKEHCGAVGTRRFGNAANRRNSKARRKVSGELLHAEFRAEICGMVFDRRRADAASVHRSNHARGIHGGVGVTTPAARAPERSAPKRIWQAESAGTL